MGEWNQNIHTAVSYLCLSTAKDNMMSWLCLIEEFGWLLWNWTLDNSWWLSYRIIFPLSWSPASQHNCVLIPSFFFYLTSFTRIVKQGRNSWPYDGIKVRNKILWSCEENNSQFKKIHELFIIYGYVTISSFFFLTFLEKYNTINLLCIKLFLLAFFFKNNPIEVKLRGHAINSGNKGDQISLQLVQEVSTVLNPFFFKRA